MISKILYTAIMAVLTVLGFILARLLLGFAPLGFMFSEEDSNTQESKALQFL